MRRNNIRIKGIADGEEETWDEVESKVKDAIKAKLDLDIDIQRAHRFVVYLINLICLQIF